MKYSIGKLSQIAGVSARTLRYYDEIGLLCPKRTDTNGYRFYSSEQIDILQQILFYREMGVALEEIRKIILSSDFDKETALENHLAALKQKKEQIEVLIQNVMGTIKALKGETIMNDKEKFEGFKRQLISDNVRKYGKEVVEKYGKEALDEGNEKLSSMSVEQWTQSEQIQKEMFDSLKKAMLTEDPSCAFAQKACELHKEWLKLFVKDGTYSKQYHRGLAELYVSDDRFKQYYHERVGEGAAPFLRDAILIYTK